jgi:hypothetical protein
MNPVEGYLRKAINTNRRNDPENVLYSLREPYKYEWKMVDIDLISVLHLTIICTYEIIGF